LGAPGVYVHLQVTVAYSIVEQLTIP